MANIASAPRSERRPRPNAMTQIWHETTRNASTYPYDVGGPVDPDKLTASDVWLQTPQIRCYYQDIFTVMSRAAAALDKYLPMVVDEITSNTIALPITHVLTNEAQLLRMSNLHLAWGINNIDAAKNLDVTYYFAKKATIFRTQTWKAETKPYQFSCIAVKFPSHPSTRSTSTGIEYVNERDEDATRTVIENICKITCAFERPVLIIGSLGVLQGHPPKLIAKMLKNALKQYPIPLVLIAMGDGKLDSKNTVYEEFYHALRDGGQADDPDDDFTNGNYE